MDDLSLFITCPDVLSYTSKMCTNSHAPSTPALIKIKESSAKNRWFTLGASQHILMPSIFPSLSAFCNIADKASAHKMNKYGEKGSPCLRPL
jgi:hypothetical protein